VDGCAFRALEVPDHDKPRTFHRRQKPKTIERALIFFRRSASDPPVAQQPFDQSPEQSPSGFKVDNVSQGVGAAVGRLIVQQNGSLSLQMTKLE